MTPADKGGNGGGVSVELRGIAKRFGRVTACQGADFTAPAGAVSGLVGENGAGKTTLMRILAGRVCPDGGRIFVNGLPAQVSSPRDAAALGIAMVEQDARLVPGLTVLENVILGSSGPSRWLIDRRRAAEDIVHAASQLGIEVDPAAPAETLSASERQRAALVRALCRGARVLILDEPTSLLSPGECEGLFATMRALAASGVAVIFISHKLSEVFEVADSITVLRCGRTVVAVRTSETSPAEVARAMIGADVAETEMPAAGEPGAVVVALEGVSTAGAGRASLEGVSLALRRGEITGVAGVAGNGQRALSDVVAGMLQPPTGRVMRSRGVRVALVGEDVDAMDLAGAMRGWENAVLGDEADYAGPLGFSVRRAKSRASLLAREFAVTGGLDAPVQSLSGGNRQRLVLAREFSRGADLVVAEEPSRGLDVAGTGLARHALRRLAARGAAVLLISYDLDELYAVADRIVVISSGRVVEPSAARPTRGELARLIVR